MRAKRALWPRRALWASCQQVSRDTAGAVRARVVRSRVTSLRALEAEHGPYAAVVVAAGAASGTIEEIGARALPALQTRPPFVSASSSHARESYLGAGSACRLNARVLASFTAAVSTCLCVGMSKTRSHVRRGSIGL